MHIRDYLAKISTFATPRPGKELPRSKLRGINPSLADSTCPASLAFYTALGGVFKASKEPSLPKVRRRAC